MDFLVKLQDIPTLPSETLLVTLNELTGQLWERGWPLHVQIYIWAAWRGGFWKEWTIDPTCGGGILMTCLQYGHSVRDLN